MIYIASDHAGINFKSYIMEYFNKNAIKYVNLGTDSNESVDYPYYAAKVAKEVLSGVGNKGILICGTGIGVSIAVNKFAGIRAALCRDKLSAELSRQHNDANVLCIGERVTNKNDVIEIVNTFLHTDFLGGRHLNRVQQIIDIEKRNFNIK